MATADNTINHSYEKEREKHLEENERRFKAWGVAKKARSRSLIVKKDSAVVFVKDRPQHKNSKSSRSSRRPGQLYQKVATKEERADRLKQAMTLQARLESEGHQCFVKSMRRSHVYQGFWLNVPSEFCNKYLDKKTFDIWLEDKEGREYETNFIGTSNGLSGGWGTFAVDHKLHDGDALVFQLIDKTRFKVHIFRGSNDGGEGNAEILKKDREVTSDKEDVELGNSSKYKDWGSDVVAENRKEEKATNPARKTKGSTSRRLQPSRSSKQLAQPRIQAEVSKKCQREAAERKKPVQKRKMKEKLLTKKRFDISQVTYFRQIVKNLYKGSKKVPLVTNS
ncbi:B3 domain-containing protein At5g42700-like [Papaver somniferum]|uniref:B3 domain-containing protein At5g42700-like n=1 Tax=Papaver somniferum TaxID=3469 RepID=UPI000E70592E|nr:B3 domain-containing protein At5g42700-like [Papaver somniferum]